MDVQYNFRLDLLTEDTWVESCNFAYRRAKYAQFCLIWADDDYDEMLALKHRCIAFQKVVKKHAEDQGWL